MYFAFLEQISSTDTPESPVAGIIAVILIVLACWWIFSDDDKGWTYQERRTGHLTKKK